MNGRRTLPQQTLDRLATLYEYADGDPAAGDEATAAARDVEDTIFVMASRLVHPVRLGLARLAKGLAVAGAAWACLTWSMPEILVWSVASVASCMAAWFSYRQLGKEVVLSTDSRLEQEHQSTKLGG